MNDFIYHVPTKVYFGEGQLSLIGEETRSYGSVALLVSGTGSAAKSGLLKAVTESLGAAGVTVIAHSGATPNPKIEFVRQGLTLVKNFGVDVIVAAGGGSAIDAAKAIALAARYDGDPWDLVVDASLIHGALPIICVSTMAATGTDMSYAAVISNPATNEKLGIHHESIIPRASFLMPSLTSSVPARTTAAGAADIMSHVFESYFSCDHDLYFLDREAEGIMRTVVEFAPKAMRHPRNTEARANLLWAQSWANNRFLAGGKSQSWSCHPIEHELSAFFDVVHGEGLAVITPAWMRYCLKRAIEWDKSGDKAIEHAALAIFDKFYNYGVNVWGISSKHSKLKVAKLAIKKTEDWLYDDLRLPSRLRELGVEKASLEDIAIAAVSHKGGCINGFVPLAERDVRKILKACY